MGSKPKKRAKSKARKSKAKSAPKKTATLVAEAPDKLETSPFPTSEETPDNAKNLPSEPIVTTLKERGPERRVGPNYRKAEQDERRLRITDEVGEPIHFIDRREASYEPPRNHVVREADRRIETSKHGQSYTEKRGDFERRVQSEEREGGLLGSAVAGSMGPDILATAPEGAEFPETNTREYTSENDYLDGNSTPPDSDTLGDSSIAQKKPTNPSSIIDEDGVRSVSVPKSTTPDVEYPPAFIRIVKLVIDSEGGYVNHPSDPGGETNFGISRRQYPEEDIKGMTKERAAFLMHRDYWQNMKLDQIDSVGVQYELMDSGFNMGNKQAVRLAQTVCVLFGKQIGSGPSQGVDGLIGPRTLQAINSLSKSHPEQFLLALNGEQYSFYKALVEHSPKKYLAFFKGWMMRLQLLKDLHG